MKKISEIWAVAQHLFSANRRKKAAVLFRENRLIFSNFFKKERRSARNKAASEINSRTFNLIENTTIDANLYSLKSMGLSDQVLNGSGQAAIEREYLVQQIPNAASYTNETTHRSVFDSQGQLLKQLSHQRKAIRAPQKLRLTPVKQLKGITANLYGNLGTAEGNYFHWLIDSLPRLFIIEKLLTPDELDYLLVPPMKYDFHWDSISALGIDQSKVVELSSLDCIEFEHLVATTPPRGSTTPLVPGWIVDRYNTAFLPLADAAASTTGKRVYVSRRDAPTRMFVNEHEVCDYLSNHGFDIVELSQLDLSNKIAVFKNADVIISQTGAGLTNLMFCDDATTVVELVDEKFLFPAYASLAWHKGATHHCHFFSDENALSKVNAMVSKSYLDINKLEESLRKVGIL